MGRRERKTDSIREMTKRGSFFSFFFRRATLPASKSTSSSPSRESIRLTPPPLLPSDIHLSPTGGPPGSRHASRAGQIEGTEALLEESRGKNETRRERFNRRRHRARGKVGGGKRARAEPSPGLLDFELLSTSALLVVSFLLEPPLFFPPKIQIGALRRYAAVFGLDVSGTCTRDELTRAIARHWDEQASFLFPFSSFFFFFFFPPPACPLLFLLARLLSFFLPLFFLSPSPVLFFCFLFFQTCERAKWRLPDARELCCCWKRRKTDSHSRLKTK